MPSTSPTAAETGPSRASSADDPGPSRGALPGDRGPANAPGPGEIVATRGPVLVELFSSEGCSSCPPADVVLRDLAALQPIADTEIVALEMHVDYWNDLGWPDPFSSEAYTARQRSYARALGDRSMYTPQMVVDGRVGFTGSQAGTARAAIAAAAKAPKARVTLTRSGDTLTLAVSDLPEPVAAADVLLALAEEGLSTDVRRGENAGAVLAHGPVVRALKKLGSIAPGAKGRAFEASESVTLPPAWSRAKVRAVVFVQATETLAIVGAASVSMK
jgi:hypothetical protein